MISQKRVLVTGGGGFLGRYVCDEIELFGPANLIAPRSSEYDLRHLEQVQAMFDKYRPEVVIHLAAVVGGIGANLKMPGTFFYDNAAMGLHLMECARLIGVEKFVCVGTVCSYPKHTTVPFSEDDFWNGYPEESNAAYGLAKKLLFVQAQAYRQQFGFNAICLLPCNLYGPGDNFDPQSSHVIPAIIRKAITARDENRDSLDVWGTGVASREFLHVCDAARGIVLATNEYDQPDPVNLGSGREITIRELTELICELCGFRGEIRWDSAMPDGQPRRCLDITRAKERFGFSATTSLRQGLIETINWYESVRQSSMESGAN